MSIRETRENIKRINDDMKKAVDGNGSTVKALQDAHKRLREEIGESGQAEAEPTLQKLDQIIKDYQEIGKRVEEVQEDATKIGANA